jgi:hypothetical protein
LALTRYPKAQDNIVLTRPSFPIGISGIRQSYSSGLSSRIRSCCRILTEKVTVIAALRER